MTTVTMSTPTTAPVPVLAIPFAPAGLEEWQARRIISSGQLATARGLRLIGRGVCRVAGHVGAPVYVVSSGSRPGLGHLVWVEAGRIQCDCEWRTLRGGFTCSHAQFVRCLLVAELAEVRSIPDAARLHVAPQVEPAQPAAPAVEPEPEPEPPAPAPTRRPRRKRAAEPAPADQAPAAAPEEPSAHAGGPSGHDRQPCPNCGALTDAAELAELGECLHCLQMRADYDRAEADAADARAIEEWAQDEAERMAEELAQRLPCWCCGAPATAETDHGLYCDECVTKPAAQQRREARARLAAEKVTKTRAAVEARQEARAAAKAEKKAEEKAETARHFTPQEQEAARRAIAHDRARTRARTAQAAPRPGDDDFGIYDRRPFSMWKSEQGR